MHQPATNPVPPVTRTVSFTRLVLAFLAVVLAPGALDLELRAGLLALATAELHAVLGGLGLGAGPLASFSRPVEIDHLGHAETPPCVREFTRPHRNEETSMIQASQIVEHMDVQGSDGKHVGRVDKVMGSEIELTK